MSDIAVRVAQRMHKSALKAYGWSDYPEDSVSEFDVPDEIWDESNPEGSMMQVQDFIDEQVGFGAGQQVLLTKQIGSDWVSVGELGRLHSLTVVGPSGKQTAESIVQAYMDQLEQDQEPVLTELVGSM